MSSGLIIGIVVLLVISGAGALIYLGIRQSQNVDPLEERLAEFAAMGEAASLEEIEMSQPFVERIIIPMANKLGEIALRFTPQKALTEIERQLAQDSAEDYNIFMAIAEKLGKDRRGNPIYLRDDDGAELLFDKETKYLSYKKDGSKEVKVRKEKVKFIDDDLPQITEAYYKFLNGGV